MQRSHRLIYRVLVLVAVCACGTLYGQTQNGSISGTAKDASGAVLPGAQIVLQPTGTTVASNAQGDFLIQNIKPGQYTVTISDVGFANSVSTVTVTAGQTALLNATMSVASANQRVVVMGTLEGDVAAINEQRTSENILNVMTAPEIANLPNQSVATVLGRMPGVTVQINEGEAQYVQIRGTEPRLSNTTMDGVIVPGPDPQVRQVDLWVIPADLMGAVEINKTLSANEDGDAILYGVQPHDALTFTLVPMFLAMVGLAACWVPAQRAAKVDPQTVLRYE